MGASKQRPLPLLTIVSVILSASTAFAAEIRTGDPYTHTMYHPDDGEVLPCHLRLEGTIFQGDLDRLKVLIPDSVRAVSKEYASDRKARAMFVLCLDSNGGNFIEGIRIAKLAIERGISTQIEKGAKCFSACAVAFIGGTYNWGGSYLSRHLHVEGTLGFHAPSLEVPQNSYNKETVETAFTSSVLAVAELAAMGKKGATSARGDRFKASLLEKMLKTGPMEIFYVNTVKQAARWNIGLVGWRAPKIGAREKWFNGCANVMIEVGDVEAEFEQEFRDLANEAIRTKRVNWRQGLSWGEHEFEVIEVTLGLFFEGIGCEIPVIDTNVDSQSVSILHYFRPDQGNNGFARMPLWMAYPPGTVISRLSK